MKTVCGAGANARPAATLGRRDRPARQVYVRAKLGSARHTAAPIPWGSSVSNGCGAIRRSNIAHRRRSEIVRYVNLFHARFNQLGSSRANIQGGVVVSRDRNRQANDEPSLAMSFGLLCVVASPMSTFPTSNLCKQTFWLTCRHKAPCKEKPLGGGAR
jgi:hypothetical protein